MSNENLKVVTFLNEMWKYFIMTILRTLYKSQSFLPRLVSTRPPTAKHRSWSRCDLERDGKLTGWMKASGNLTLISLSGEKNSFFICYSGTLAIYAFLIVYIYKNKISTFLVKHSYRIEWGCDYELDKVI